MAITQTFIDNVANNTVTNAQDINDYFTNNYSQDFITWFNDKVGGRNNWAAVPGGRAAISMATDADAQQRFTDLWSDETIQTAFGSSSITLLQFIALQCIINNETGGTLIPGAEKVGTKLHPGIAYAFDSIATIPKISYNTMSGNKTCFDLFNDSDYNNNFSQLPLGDVLANTSDNVWAGNAYPASTVSTSTDPSITGYVLEADFYKFRGRGYIQTTGRSNYKSIVDFVMNYTGANQIILNAQMNWKIRSTDNDVLATVSSNAEWDDLFQNSGLIIPAKAIALHNAAAGNYLGNIDTTSPDTTKTTVRRVGLRISGGSAYADLYINRVTQLIEQL